MLTRAQRASRVGAILLVVFIVAGGCLLVSPAPPAFADIQIAEKLFFLSDFRARYEIDQANDRFAPTGLGGPTSGADVRDRAIIRFRFGFRYQATDATEFGTRFRTTSNKLQSPHQVLGGKKDFTTSKSAVLDDSNDDFGLDRAYIKFKWLDNGFFWFGKNQAAIWQQNEQYWDADYQAEGATVGYVFGLGAQGKLTLQASYYYIAENDWTGLFQDRAIMPLQAVYERDLGPASLTLAVAGAPTTANEATTTAPTTFATTGTATTDAAGTDARFPGGKRTYYLYSAELKFKKLPIPVTVGYEVYHGTGETLGHGVGLRVKPLEKLELRGYYYYVPLNSVPLQGAIVQDDLRFSSNFKGAQFIATYHFTPAMNMDFRVYPQDTIREGLSAAEAPGRGNYVQRVHDTTRFQTNLNIKF